ncbi:TPA: hypothetical protein RPW15_001503 [Campylobacter fetus subsp. venerealis]|nr:hypothetical protein [Campylobacter fetus subsp. venerealis]HDX6253982.1 hypothetical protein [Campylobacter fetus subsp. venerealis]HDX6258170.1 hypothetical protein [Campylobacter fetus subsp. venerealis]HDX6261829.1 hypothetical protein [Campylobacter fetus subsp. venerealis]HDX6263959.1 hypothetical protein [Campylobacter fetus subsp. venerealis]
MKKAELIEKLKELKITQVEFCELVGRKSNALNGFRNEDEVPLWYDKTYELLVKIRQQEQELEVLRRMIKVV